MRDVGRRSLQEHAMPCVAVAVIYIFVISDEAKQSRKACFSLIALCCVAAGGFALSVLLRVLAGVAKKLSRRMWGVCWCVSTLVSRPAIAVNYVRMVRQSAISAIHIRPGPVRLAIPDSFSSGSSTKRVRASVYV